MGSLNLLVSDQDVSAAIKGGIPADDVAWVRNLIGRATRLLVRLIPDLPSRVGDGTVDGLFVSDVIVDAVLRVVRNPEGYYREQEGEYGYSKSVDVASGKLEFTDAELDSLSPAYGSARAFTIVPG